MPFFPLVKSIRQIPAGLRDRKYHGASRECDKSQLRDEDLGELVRDVEAPPGGPAVVPELRDVPVRVFVEEIAHVGGSVVEHRQAVEAPGQAALLAGRKRDCPLNHQETP